MQRIDTVTPATTPADAQAMLQAVERKLGMVPNLFKTFAHSPAALKAYLSQSEALAGGVLSTALREQIALVSAGLNGCDYCASAHSLMGKGAGLSAEEVAANLRGNASDARAQAALDFATVIIRQRGQVPDEAIAAVRRAGFSDAELVEIVANVALNLFTNYFNNLAHTVVDFPRVSAAA